MSDLDDIERLINKVLFGKPKEEIGIREALERKKRETN